MRAKDKRLAILEGIEAGSTLGLGKGKNNWKDYWNIQDNKAITLSVALAHEKSKQTYENIIVKFHGGGIASDGDITIKAKDIKNGEIKLIGQTLQGRNINLETYNLTTDSGETTEDATTRTHTDEIHAGIEWGKNGAITPEGGFSITNGEVKEKGITHTPTLIAGNHVTIHAGGNANIQGSAIRGKRVDMDVQGDLSITSDQESYTYLAKNSAIGANISAEGVSASASKGKTDYTLLTVKEQAGIFGGDEGINIKVGGKTKLTGALIGSAATSDKNKVVTGSLEMKNIENISKLDDSGIGAGYQNGAGVEHKDKGLTPMIPIATNKEKKSITYAAIVDGELIVTGDKDFNVDDVNRNTQDTLNALENTLDLQELAERKRMTELFGKYVNAEIHRLSENNHWSDGDWQKIVLHAASGAIQGKLAGGSMSAGALTGAVNEAVNGAIAKYNATHPKEELPSDAHQWLSAALGAIIGKATGDTVGTQAAIAASATKNNFDLVDPLIESLKRNKQDYIVKVLKVFQRIKDEENLGINPDGTLDLGKNVDFIFCELSPGEKFAGVSIRGIMDKYGQIYVSISGYLGAGIGVANIGRGMLATPEREQLNSSQFQKYIEGVSGAFSAIGGVGGEIAVGQRGPLVAIRGGAEASVTINLGYTQYLARIK